MQLALPTLLLLVTGLILRSAAPFEISGDSARWRFTDVTREAGIDLTVVAGSPEKRFLVETVTGGCCVLDFDNDGWPDLFFVNGTTRELRNSGRGPSSRLYRNNRDGTFTDVTREAGLLDSVWGMGCVAADFDNDGYADLYVTNWGSNFLYRNNGDGTFTEMAMAAGVDDPGWSTGAAFGDFDRDGYLDLYVANYVEFEFQLTTVDPRFCSYRGAAVACGPRGLPAAPDSLFRNNGDGTFTDVSKRAGVRSVESMYGFQPVWTDVDGDGHPDVFVANDATPNFLWLNNGDGTFTEKALLLGLAYNQEGREQANMGVDLADYDGDGRLDLYSTNFSEDYNVLYRRAGEGYFVDATFAAGLAQPTFRYLGWGTLFIDLDNDGLADLFVANGHLYPEVDEFRLGSSYRQLNQVFRNLGSGRFEEIGPRLGAGLAAVKSSRGAAWADWDRDGDLDLVVSNLDDRVDLLRNDLPSGSNYLQIRLRGRRSNRGGVGARVALSTESGTQVQELRAGSSFLSSNEPILHFGLGRHGAADRIEVIWPSGARQELENVEGRRRILIDEEEGLKEDRAER